MLQGVDVASVFNTSTGQFDWLWFAGDIATTSSVGTSDLESWIITQLFSDAKNIDPAFNDVSYQNLNRGYWGDIFHVTNCGSLLWKLMNMPVTQSTLGFAQTATQTALQPLLTYNIVGSMTVTTSWINTPAIGPYSGILIYIQFTNPSGTNLQPIKYSWFYNQAYQSALNPTATLVWDSPWTVWDLSYAFDN